jgi:hypothetical protein
MRKTTLLTFGVLMLLAGIALAIYGYYLEPTVGEALGNIFDGDFTDKRNIIMLIGLGLAVAGGASVAGGALSGRSVRSA